MIGPVHEAAAWGLIIVALLHAAAALKHHFLDRDNVLKRML
jgi:cytochrome b561